MTSYELWQFEKYNNVIADTEPEEVDNEDCFNSEPTNEKDNWNNILPGYLPANSSIADDPDSCLFQTKTTRLMTQFLVTLLALIIVYGGIIALHLRSIKEHMVKNTPPTLSKHADYFLTKDTKKI